MYKQFPIIVFTLGILMAASLSVASENKATDQLPIEEISEKTAEHEIERIIAGENQNEQGSIVEKLMPKYGNWCGANHPKDVDMAGDPIDLLDKSCQQHDYCYANEGYFNCNCDNAINQELIAGLHANTYEKKEAIFARSIHLYFNGSPCNGDHSTKVGPSRAVHNIVKSVGKKAVNVVKAIPLIGEKISGE